MPEDTGSDLKEIRDKIFEAYKQLVPNCLNIAFLMIEPWFIDEINIKHVEDILDKEPEKLPRLNAVIFRLAPSLPNHVWENPNTCAIDQRLKSFIREAKFKE